MSESNIRVDTVAGGKFCIWRLKQDESGIESGPDGGPNGGGYTEEELRLILSEAYGLSVPTIDMCIVDANVHRSGE